MKRRIILSIALVLSIVFVSLIISNTGIVAPEAAIVETAVNPAPPTPCDLIKGKTYVGFNTGKFDAQHLDAASAAKFTFDKQGAGTGRMLLVHDPTSDRVTQQLVTITCTWDGTDSVLNFWIGTQDKGKTKFWVYEDGARLWGEPTDRNRPMDGWSLQLPVPPSKIQ